MIKLGNLLPFLPKYNKCSRIKFFPDSVPLPGACRNQILHLAYFLDSYLNMESCLFTSYKELSNKSVYPWTWRNPRRKFPIYVESEKQAIKLWVHAVTLLTYASRARGKQEPSLKKTKLEHVQEDVLRWERIVNGDLEIESWIQPSMDASGDEYDGDQEDSS